MNFEIEEDNLGVRKDWGRDEEREREHRKEKSFMMTSTCNVWQEMVCQNCK